MTLVIGMIIFPELTQLDMTAPHEVFARLPSTKILLVSEDGAPLKSENGLLFAPDVSFEQAPELDMIFVPGGVGIGQQMQNDRFLDFLADRGQKASYVTSVCTGSLLLGAAGLLQGYKATTHWLSLDLLPLFGAEVVRERFVQDRNRITGGGVTAGIDFGLRLSAEIFGRDLIEAIQLQIEYDPDPPFSGSPRNAPPELVESVTQSRAHIQAKRKLLIEENIARRGMVERT